jgi:[ribosomal protein S5]-alanine N-acetyltransferase
MTPPETLHTARLVLRKATREDAPLMFAAYGQDHEVAHYVPWRPHTCLSDSEAVIGRFLDSWRDGCAFNWLLFQSGGSELMGAIGVRREAHQLELGYVLARRHWGCGFMAEAVTAVVDWAFSEPSVLRVGAVCDIDNQRSARLLERAGFKREGVLRSWAVHPNISAMPRDCYSYSKIRNT